MIVFWWWWGGVFLSADNGPTQWPQQQQRNVRNEPRRWRPHSICKNPLGKQNNYQCSECLMSSVSFGDPRPPYPPKKCQTITKYLSFPFFSAACGAFSLSPLFPSLSASFIFLLPLRLFSHFPFFLDPLPPSFGLYPLTPVTLLMRCHWRDWCNPSRGSSAAGKFYDPAHNSDQLGPWRFRRG